MKNHIPTKNEITRFTLILPVTLGIALSFWIDGFSYLKWYAPLAALLMVAGIFAPMKLSLIYKGWLKIVMGIGEVISFVCLFLLFYLIVTPLGFVVSIISPIKGFDIESKTSSYWHTRQPQTDKTVFERQY